MLRGPRFIDTPSPAVERERGAGHRTEPEHHPLQGDHAATSSPRSAASVFPGRTIQRGRDSVFGVARVAGRDDQHHRWHLASRSAWTPKA